MNRIPGLLAAAIITISAAGQSTTGSTGREAILDKLCGCFEVSFKYAETFSPDPGYKFHEREEIGGTAELALPIEVSEKKIVIQHLLVVSPSMVVKHWREEWTYENPVIWKYKGDKTWVKENLATEQVRGKWTQTVWEVSDEPRYQGLSRFVEMDGKLIWQNSTDAPLPRREYTVRDDYNVLKRTNRLNLCDSGYIHEQDNQKILRGTNGDRLIVEEKGINAYKRISEKECAAATEYWEKNKEYWGQVRRAWSELIENKSVISLKTKVDGKMLHELLMQQAKQFQPGKSNYDPFTAIRDAIGSFVVDQPKPTAHN